MKLMIVESPSKVETLAGILGSDWKVVASYGHIRDLPRRELGVDLSDFSLQYEFMPGLPGKPHTDAAQRIRRMRGIASEAEVVYLATDPDREGEAISWHLKEALRLGEDDYKRITFGSIEGPAIREALNNARRIDMDMVHAQEGRRALDRLVGYLVSPVLSNAAGGTLSAGRVQSVALRLIVDREAAIRKFRVTDHFSARMKFDGGAWEARWDTSPFVSEDQPYVLDRALADQAAACRAFRVEASETKEAKEAPPAPFCTSTLLQAASVRLKFSTDETMKAAQGLFEGVGAEHGHISYHRTDSINFTVTSLGEIRGFLESAGLPVADKPRTWKGKAGAQEGHQAIRPTDLAVEEVGNTAQERALYKLIRERALACQLADARYSVTSLALVATDAGEGRAFVFKAEGRVLTFAGWRELTRQDDRDADADDADDDEGGRIPKLSEGTAKVADSGELLKLKTSAPKRYTEASLVKTLEHEQIGRPSTYASIVSTILKRNYVTLEKRLFVPTAVGEMIVEALVKAGFGFVELAFTRDMENGLDAIAQGQGSYRELVEAAHAGLQTELENVAISKSILPRFKCPKCEGAMRRIVKGDRPAFWYCSTPECKTAMDDDKGKPVERKTYPCPHCKGEMRRYHRRKGGGYVWACTVEECETFLDDVNGEPVALHNCPKCSSPLRRFQRKDAAGKPTKQFGWFCTSEDCKTFMDDDNGKPLAVKSAPCPTCGKPMYRRKGQYGFWWGCSGFKDGCKTMMDDDNGRPVPKRARKASGGPGAVRKPGRPGPAKRPPIKRPPGREPGGPSGRRGETER